MTLRKNNKSQTRHVVISGGTRGLGKCLIEGMLKSGYKVSTFGRKPTDFVISLSNEEKFFFAVANVSDTTTLEKFLDPAEKKLGPIYALINNAGIATNGVLATMPTDQIDKVLSVNLAGSLYLSRLVIRRMLLNLDAGVIINISSTIGLRGYSGLSAYAATKAGMDAVSRSLARELGSRRVRVNSIAPGYLETEMTHGLTENQKKQIIRRTPLGRLGRPEDVIGPLLFLLSEDSSFITGQVFVVDGGITV